jgi:hypothetical protein
MATPFPLTRETEFQHQKCEKGGAGIPFREMSAQVCYGVRTRVNRCSSQASGTVTTNVTTNKAGIEPV